jgi:cytochrome c oxidase cbb3-type subunit 1
VLYIAALWISGVTQGLMWRALNDDGTLTYTFVQSVKASIPFYIIRLVGGLLYLSGMVVMLWNTVMTARQGLKVGTLPAVQIPAVAAHA